MSAGASESPAYQGKRGQRLSSSTHASSILVPTSVPYRRRATACSGTWCLLIISIIRYLPTFYESCRVHRLITFESLCSRAYPNFASLSHILFICLFTRRGSKLNHLELTLRLSMRPTHSSSRVQPSTSACAVVISALLFSSLL